MLPSDREQRDYQQAARHTAVYPATLAMVYPALGLVGETGEYLTAQKEGAPLPDLHKELGDVCWYAANLADDLGFDLSSLPSPDGGGVELFTVAAAIAEQVKKVARDDGGTPQDIRQERLRNLLGRLLQLLALEAERLETDLAAVMSTNIDKLASRADRGQLHGDGDDR